MLIHAAKHYGVIGHGVSLSEAQTELARERIRAEGLEDRITIEIKSYADLDGSFDKISSIGMFEHTGLANHADLFHDDPPPAEAGRHLPAPRDHAALQGRRKTLRKEPEYRALIKYIFPGGEVDTIGMTLSQSRSAWFPGPRRREPARCTMRGPAGSGRSGCRRRSTRHRRGRRGRARLWLLYLTGCSISFERGSMQIFQTVATRRDARAQRPAADPRRPLSATR